MPSLRRSTRRARRAWALVAVIVLVVPACRDHTVAIRFEPSVGDRYDFRSTVATEVTRIADGDTTTEMDRSVLDATETVTAIDSDEVTLNVQLARDGVPARGYTARFDRSDRLSAIDLVGGVPSEALGLDLSSGLPADVASPPDGPLEPGSRWRISRPVASTDTGSDTGTGDTDIEAGDGDVTVGSTVITGSGWVESLGRQDGRDVAVVVVELRVPVRATLDTADGVVRVRGVQTSRSRTTYDLADGAARRDHTEVTGSLAVTVDAPPGVDAAPVEAVIDYRVESDTRRVNVAST